MPLHPCKESLDDPAPLIGVQPASVLLEFLVFRSLTGTGTHWAINHWLS